MYIYTTPLIQFTFIPTQLTSCTLSIERTTLILIQPWEKNFKGLFVEVQTGGTIHPEISSWPLHRPARRKCGLRWIITRSLWTRKLRVMTQLQMGAALQYFMKLHNIPLPMEEETCQLLQPSRSWVLASLQPIKIPTRICSKFSICNENIIVANFFFVVRIAFWPSVMSYNSPNFKWCPLKLKLSVFFRLVLIVIIYRQKERPSWS